MGKRIIRGGSPVGFIQVSTDNWLPVDQILFILTTTGRTADAIRGAYREDNRVLDLTRGKKMRSQLVMKNGLMVLTPLKPNTVVDKISFWFVTKGDTQA